MLLTHLFETITRFVIDKRTIKFMADDIIIFQDGISTLVTLPYYFQIIIESHLLSVYDRKLDQLLVKYGIILKNF
jgi:hypothetical protein